jgi:predicted metal-dependent hydrolase
MNQPLLFELRFREGVAHFNAREFWEAHESWEELWLAAETDLEQFLQGLIQLAAAYHHVQRGTFPGAVRLFEAALRRLDAFPLQFCGIDRTEAVEAARRHREWISGRIGSPERLSGAEFPRLLPDESPMAREVW